MPQKRSIGLVLINTAMLAVLEIVALNLLVHNGEYQRFFLLKGVHSFQAVVWGGTEGVKHYFTLGKTNKQLAAENYELSRRLREYEYKISLDEARDQMVPMRKGDLEMMPGTIEKISRNKNHNYLILGQGSEDGVTEGSGVIVNNGVVGIVDAVSRHYSYVISFQNSGFSVSGRVGRKGNTGLLVWDGRHQRGGIMRDVPLYPKVEEGDTVYTSGFSSIFPPDVPLGVTGCSKVVNGATYEITVNLFMDPASLRYVTIVKNRGKDEMEMLEGKEGAR